MNHAITVLGIMSGSSLDGLDLAICSFSGQSPEQITWKCEHTKAVSFPPSLIHKLKTATTVSAIELIKTEVDFTTFCGEAIKDLLNEYQGKVDYIAHHGHTIFHDPSNRYTKQIINGGQLAAQTGIPTLIDFRSQDIALGGQGAPIAPIVEQWLLRDFGLFLNLGGIANLSVKNSQNEIIAFDVCPCNQTLNFLANELQLEYDKGGIRASKGNMNQDLLSIWNTIPYFAQAYPKSLDNTWCHDNFTSIATSNYGSTEDRLRTTVEFVTEQITNDIQELDLHHDYKQLFITGGGAFNTYLVEQLENKLEPTGIEVIIPYKETIAFKEAILMALMGYLRIMNIPNTIPSVTGASSATVGGSLYLPST